MLRKIFLELTKYPSKIIEFSVVDGWQHLPDLTPRTLWDVCDIGVRLGHRGYDIRGKEGMYFEHNTVLINVYNFLGNGIGGRAGIVIGRYRPGRVLQTSENGVWFLSLLNDMLVLWDRDVEVIEIKRMIHQVDESLYATDLMIGGRRAVCA